MIFHATQSTVEIQDATGAVVLVPTLMFYEAIPGAPQWGTARIEGTETTCAIVEYDEYSKLRDELIQRREFIPLEDYINDHAEQWDLEQALRVCQSFEFFTFITEKQR